MNAPGDVPFHGVKTFVRDIALDINSFLKGMCNMDYHFLLDIALILISTKLLGMLTRKIQMPQVVGALIAGVILGPAVLNIVHDQGDLLKKISEIGVIVLMFTAGLETDIGELKKSGKASFVIAMFGVIVPLFGGWAVAHFFNTGEGASASVMLQNIFIGIILTATSVSISVETLREMGKLSTRAGNAILGAALIDDILGIIALTVITSLADTTVNIWVVSLKILAFFVLAVVIGILANKLLRKWFARYKKDLRRFVIVAFALCLFFSFSAEHFFGVADITGAFIAGLIISGTQETKYIASRFETLSYMFLSPIFFASIGLQIVVPQMGWSIVLFTLLLLVVAILSKVVGCGVGARVMGYTNRESMQIGVGMISRGEVALIVSSKGAALGLMSTAFFGPVALVVVVTTIVTPIFLKLAFAKSKKYEGLEESTLAEKYEETYELDRAEQVILEMNKEMMKKREKPQEKK